jgi:hypothetical protein
VFNRRLVSAGTGSFTLDIPAYTTVLYYLGDSAPLQRTMRR